METLRVPNLIRAFRWREDDETETVCFKWGKGIGVLQIGWIDPREALALCWRWHDPHRLEMLTGSVAEILESLLRPFEFATIAQILETRGGQAVGGGYALSEEDVTRLEAALAALEEAG